MTAQPRSTGEVATATLASFTFQHASTVYAGGVVRSVREAKGQISICGTLTVTGVRPLSGSGCLLRRCSLTQILGALNGVGSLRLN